MRQGFQSAAAMLLLSACASAPAPHAAESPPDAIAMDVNSWGKPLSAWQIAADGAGSYAFSRQAPSKNFDEYDLVTKRVWAGREGFARLRAILAPVEKFAGREVPCKLIMTDGAYGHVAWRRGETEAKVNYHVGCNSRDANAVQEAAFAADALVRSWAEAAPVAGLKEVRRPQDATSAP
jgi:hypothetical protein